MVCNRKCGACGQGSLSMGTLLLSKSSMPLVINIVIWATDYYFIFSRTLARDMAEVCLPDPVLIIWATDYTYITYEHIVFVRSVSGPQCH